MRRSLKRTAGAGAGVAEAVVLERWGPPASNRGTHCIELMLDSRGWDDRLDDEWTVYRHEVNEAGNRLSDGCT